jgi:hypothetical protein
MKTLTTLLSPLYLFTWLFILRLFTADFTSASPVVEVNQPLTVTIAGASEEVQL